MRLALIAILLTGCVQAGGRPMQETLAPTATPSSTTTARSLSIVSPTGTLEATPLDWGPLAVSRDLPGGDTARTTGILRISERCVVLHQPNGINTVLVWPQENTSWDEDGEQIVFETRDGRSVELRDRQRISVGGSGQPLDADDPEGISWDEWVTSVEWVAEPDRSCKSDSEWSVGDVVVDS